MKILLTSGGAKVPIDEVRSITNMSSGTFGAKIGVECLNRGNELYFLTSKDGKTPLKFSYDCNKKSDLIRDASEFSDWSDYVCDRYRESSYVTFDDYSRTLKDFIDIAPIDVIILAAAIPDYDVINKVQGKIRSKGDMKIDLTPLPKIINKVKNDWGYKGILVGFKLLVGATEDELIDSAQQSIFDNKCDFVVANDLHDLKKNNHKIMIVTKYTVTHVPKEKAIGAILDKIKELKG